MANKRGVLDNLTEWELLVLEVALARYKLDLAAESRTWIKVGLDHVWSGLSSLDQIDALQKRLEDTRGIYDDS